jgi:23S rRNA (guanosine2251-2'-O)-methyltransferase
LKTGRKGQSGNTPKEGRRTESPRKADSSKRPEPPRRADSSKRPEPPRKADSSKRPEPPRKADYSKRPAPAKQSIPGKQPITGKRPMPGRRPEPGDRQPTSGPPTIEIITGRHAVREALRAGRRVRRLLFLDETPRSQAVEEAVSLAQRLGVPNEATRRERLDSMALEHQGLVAIVAPYEYASWGDILKNVKATGSPPAILILDTLQDPQNFGTLLRTADALQIDAVVLPKHRSVQVTPAVVRASSGAVEHLAVAAVPNLGRALDDLKEAGFWVAGLSMDGDREYWELDMSGPTALVLGGEDHGIGRLLKEKCDFLIRLPMQGHVNSLNAAVAGSVVLYEMARQRRLKASELEQQSTAE